MKSSLFTSALLEELARHLSYGSGLRLRYLLSQGTPPDGYAGSLHPRKTADISFGYAPAQVMH